MKSDINQLKEQASAILSLNDDAKFYYKVSMVNLILSGIPANTLANCSGVSQRKLSGWVNLVDTEGFEALHEKQKSSKHGVLTEVILSHIDSLLQEDKPEIYGYEKWDGVSLSTYLKEQFDVDYSVRSCQRLKKAMTDVPHERKP